MATRAQAMILAASTAVILILVILVSGQHLVSWFNQLMCSQTIGILVTWPHTGFL